MAVDPVDVERGRTQRVVGCRRVSDRLLIERVAVEGFGPVGLSGLRPLVCGKHKLLPVVAGAHAFEPVLADNVVNSRRLGDSSTQEVQVGTAKLEDALEAMDEGQSDEALRVHVLAKVEIFAQILQREVEINLLCQNRLDVEVKCLLRRVDRGRHGHVGKVASPTGGSASALSPAREPRAPFLLDVSPSVRTSSAAFLGCLTPFATPDWAAPVEEESTESASLDFFLESCELPHVSVEATEPSALAAVV
ncbi:hypothetical protein HYQ46_002562 [Verticillium longisporum]|nr:hypothetical protein HYQ46_002562 [Verticillium longisporum]